MGIRRLVLQRSLTALPTLGLVSVLIFAITYLVPGDPAATLAGPNATNADLERLRETLNLDGAPIPRFFDWLGSALTGDFGTSLTNGRSVGESIAEGLPVTLSLVVGTLLIAVLIGPPLGAIAATGVGSPRDRITVILASIGLSIPSYWLGILLVIAFAVGLNWLPASGYVGIGESPVEWFKHMILPCIALSVIGAAELVRQMRGALIETLQMDYVRTARMKGLPARTIVGKHALKNAMIPVITTIGLQVSVLIGGAALVERVFALPGIGSLALTSVQARDIPMIQAITLLATIIVIVVNLVVDVIVALLNPRVRMA